ncbi:MAG: glycosyltransferase [Humidesulfovibrio sp.]|nr:glycosyltransferase [Humidesulfovibrio sp.]
MPAAPKVSVALPCFNAGQTLPGALTSLLGQTLADIEIVAVDDGSTDTTWDVLCAFAARDQRLRPIRLPHQGVALAGNAAVAACRAQLIARMDADDIALPGRLAAQAALLDAEPGLDLVSGLVRFGGDRRACAGYAHYVDWINTLVTPEAIAVNRFVEAPLANPSVMFRRAAFERFGGARPNTGATAGAAAFPEDYEMWLRWLSLGARMAKAPQEVIVWNDPPTRLSRTHEAYSPQAFARTKAGYLWDWLAAHNPRHPDVRIWGAGRVSRQRLAPLVALGLNIQAYIDIDPRKIGQTVHGAPVLGREAVPPYAPAALEAWPGGLPFLLVNVGSRGARAEIMAWLAGQGYQAGKDCVAVG